MKVKPLIYKLDGEWRVSAKPPKELKTKGTRERWRRARKHVRKLNNA